MKSKHTRKSIADFDIARWEREAIFHDKWGYSVDINHIKVREAFESPTAVENKYILNLLSGIKGKTILDLGCGIGDASTYFARKGATVYAIDVSSGMVDVTRRLAHKYGVSERVHAEQMVAEALQFDDNFFDFVYGNGILHHVDFMQVSREVHRVLGSGGLAAFIEPLTYNPVIWAYRAMARSVRTEDEHPLSAKDIYNICNGYQANPDNPQWRETSHREFQMFTLLIMVWFLIGERVLPSQEKYWKRFVEQGQRYRLAFRLLNGVDRFFYRFLPISRWLSWNTVIILRK